MSDLDWKDQYASSFGQLRRPSQAYWEELWAGMLKGASCSRVLDVGCGDGGFLAWIEEKGFDGLRTGVDNSIAMISIAKRASLRTCFLLCDARDLPFRAESFDALVVSNVLHHTGIEEPFLGGLARVLTHGGRLIIGVADVDDLAGYWEYEFFPSALKIDRQRLPSIASIYEHCSNAKFKFIYSERALIESRQFDDEFVNRVRKRHMSSLWLIPEREFEEGIQSLSEEAARVNRQQQDIYLHVLVFEKDF